MPIPAISGRLVQNSTINDMQAMWSFQAQICVELYFLSVDCWTTGETGQKQVSPNLLAPGAVWGVRTSYICRPPHSSCHQACLHTSQQAHWGQKSGILLQVMGPEGNYKPNLKGQSHLTSHTYLLNFTSWGAWMCPTLPYENLSVICKCWSM